MKRQPSLPAAWWYAVTTYAKTGQWRGVWLLFRAPVYFARICREYQCGRGEGLERVAFAGRVRTFASRGRGSSPETTPRGETMKRIRATKATAREIRRALGVKAEHVRVGRWALRLALARGKR